MNQEPIVVPPSPNERLHAIAKEWYNREASPLDPVDDNVACVDSLTNILRLVYPDFPHLESTAELEKTLRHSQHFAPTLDAHAGSIILNVTGSGNGTIRGHCGIIGDHGRIYSNNSLTGLWDTYYTLETWRARYRIKGGMPTLIFRPI